MQSWPTESSMSTVRRQCFLCTIVAEVSASNVMHVLYVNMDVYDIDAKIAPVLTSVSTMYIEVTVSPVVVPKFASISGKGVSARCVVVRRSVHMLVYEVSVRIVVALIFVHMVATNHGVLNAVAHRFVFTVGNRTRVEIAVALGSVCITDTGLVA